MFEKVRSDQLRLWCSFFNLFPHKANLQQTTLNMSSKRYGKSRLIVGLVLKKVENILAKGEIARLEQFLLLSRCFQKSSAADASKCVYMWEGVKRETFEITISKLTVSHIQQM